jgi:hypothetical protein
MQPDPSKLLEKIGITHPLVGLYVAPDAAPFKPLVSVAPGEGTCIFAFYPHWLKGETLHLTEEHFGCMGAGSSLLGVVTRSPEEMVEFLVDEEGLKCSRDLMRQWLTRRKPRPPEYANVLIGPLRPEQYEYLKTVTFYVNPDQLGALLLGANYNAGPDDPMPVLAPFGSGCSQMLTLFRDLNVAQAVIGGTDIAMRQWLPPYTLAFTVTKPMFRQLCELDEKSFLYKPFLQRLHEARAET